MLELEIKKSKARNLKIIILFFQTHFFNIFQSENVSIIFSENVSIIFSFFHVSCKGGLARPCPRNVSKPDRVIEFQKKKHPSAEFVFERQLEFHSRTKFDVKQTSLEVLKSKKDFPAEFFFVGGRQKILLVQAVKCFVCASSEVKLLYKQCDHFQLKLFGKTYAKF